mgnify:CR=1 FL=1
MAEMVLGSSSDDDVMLCDDDDDDDDDVPLVDVPDLAVPATLARPQVTNKTEEEEEED